MASSANFHFCKLPKLVHVPSKLKIVVICTITAAVVTDNGIIILICVNMWYCLQKSAFSLSLWTLTGIAFTKKPLKSIHLVKDRSNLHVRQVAQASSSVSDLLLHIIVPKRSTFHSSPLNYTHDWGKWLTVENVTSFLWYSICLDLMTLWKMDVSGGQLKYPSALQHQVVLVKCKLKCNASGQLFPIHLELPSNRYTHIAFVRGKCWEVLIK